MRRKLSSKQNIESYNQSSLELERRYSEDVVFLQQAKEQEKELHDRKLELKGNIRVFCRVRPPLKTELEKEKKGKHQ